MSIHDTCIYTIKGGNIVGRNIDMIKMFGDFWIACPHCKHRMRASETYLDDVDVDGSDFNPFNGVWQVTMFCYKCDKEFPLRLNITAEQVYDSPKQTVIKDESD